MSFDRFGFCDQGANLALQYMVSHGDLPTIDFGYNYGLLPILVGHWWFAVFGSSAVGYQVGMVACNVLAAIGIAAVLTALNVGLVGVILTILTLGFAVQSTYPNLSQALEAVLLITAIAQQSRGANSAALVFGLIGIFAKPAMGYPYSLLLILIIAGQLVRAGSSAEVWIKSFAPAVIFFLVLGLVLSATYGLRPFINTILPIEGAANYRAAHFGFFHGAGREFWDTTGVPWWAHLFDISGFWMLGTVLLIAFALSELPRLVHSPDLSPECGRRTGVVVTCTLLHLTFVCLFFGSRGSWIYYSYMLVIGLAISVDSSRIRRDFGIVLCLVAMFSWTDVIIAEHKLRETTLPSPLTGGLWASDEERREWSSISTLASQNQTRILDLKGAAELMFRGFGRPVTLYLDPGLIRDPEIARKVEQLGTAHLVVVPINIPSCSGTPDAPAIASELQSFKPLWTGQFFQVLERVGPS